MMRFEYQFDEVSPKVTMEFSAESSLSEVVEQFQNFLRAAGYCFEGELDFIPVEEAQNENANA